VFFGLCLWDVSCFAAAGNAILTVAISGATFCAKAGDVNASMHTVMSVFILFQFFLNNSICVQRIIFAGVGYYFSLRFRICRITAVVTFALAGNQV
jgi:urease alpha subunit